MEEMANMQQKYINMLNEEAAEELAKNKDVINSFKELSLSKGLELIDEHFSYIRTIGIVASYPNIISVLCPEIRKDKEGLFDFSQLCTMYEKKSFAEGLLYSKDFMLMAHSGFRRGFHNRNNFAPQFIKLFWNDTFSNINPYIALDCNRVRIDVNNGLYIELDTWYGAKFNKEISSIPDGVCKLRPPLDIDSFVILMFFKNVYSLDIKWTTKGTVKTFQSEEFKTEDVTLLKNGNLVHPVRYIHAEFDLEQNHFRHFDGAIHYYTPEQYYARRDDDLNYNSKNSAHIKSQSEKLFKLNGRFDVDMWIKYMSHFMSGNPLVFEYFEGKYPRDIEDILSVIQKRETII